MSEHSIVTGSAVIPTVRYRDIAAAIEWLQRAFGLHLHRVVKNAEGAPIYGELAFGSGMVMVAPIQDSPFGKLMVQPDEVGGAETQISYLLVDDIIAHYSRAKAAGAEILFDIDSEPDSNGYSCRDLEGHVWNVGTYDPWAVEPSALEEEPAPQPRRNKAFAACVALTIAGCALAYAYGPAWDANEPTLNMMSEMPATAEPAKTGQDVAASNKDDTAVRDLQQQLAQEQLARTAAERHVKDLREQLAEERRAREAAELATRNVHHIRADVPPAPAPNAAHAAATDARNELSTARAALRVALERAADAEKAKDAAERAAEEARAQAAGLRNARQQAEHAARHVRSMAMRERRRRIFAERTLRIAKTSPYTPFPVDKRP